jgi:hypothetical protein
VLYASGSFEKIEMQEFPNFQNLQFVKNTKFSKFSQNLSFYFRDLSPKKDATNYIKHHQKKIGWNRRTHGSELWRVGKY